MTTIGSGRSRSGDAAGVLGMLVTVPRGREQTERASFTCTRLGDRWVRDDSLITMPVFDTFSQLTEVLPLASES